MVHQLANDQQRGRRLGVGGYAAFGQLAERLLDGLHAPRAGRGAGVRECAYPLIACLHGVAHSQGSGRAHDLVLDCGNGILELEGRGRLVPQVRPRERRGADSERGAADRGALTADVHLVHAWIIDYVPAMALKRIVCGTDFSADASSALRRAMMLAAEHTATLEVLHVVPQEPLDALRQWVPDPAGFPDRLVRAAREELDGCAAGAAKEAGIRIETRVVIGDVTRSIMERGASADLLVVGAHGTNPLKDMLIGTTAERLAGRCTTPILVVRTAPQRAYSRVLVAVDLLPGSEEVMAAALAFAGTAVLTALHAFDVPFDGMLQRAGVAQSQIDSHRARAHQEALEQIAGLSRKVAGDADRFLAFAERGHPAATIVNRQQSMGADLVVIRKRARSVVEAVLLGSVTRHVLTDATSDVLLLAE